ncbi:class I SAM-dependent methyltransferase [Fibrobacterales bacterium]|nr:class I SAM-dependent methyltransferase [Fibrobacterales bacterium]
MSTPQINNSPYKANTSEISSDFSRAANSYSSNSTIQKKMADKLLEQVKRSRQQMTETTLDLGSGIGYLRKAFENSFPSSNFISNDISHTSLALQTSNNCVVSDFSKLPFQNQSINNCISNAALQWSPSLEDSFQEINRVLKKNGVFCFTLLGKNHFCELDEASQISNFKFSSPIQKYSSTEIESIIQKLNWTLINKEEHQVESQFTTITEMLRHFRNTGVRANQKQSVPVKTLSKNWTQSDTTKQFPLTWSWHSWVITIN